MKFFRKYSFVIFGFGILALYFFTRLYNILGLPIFTDEAIYVRWAQIASNDAAWRFISLTDGKQPMYVWIAMVLMKIINDPLLAGRVVSVIAGFMSMIGLYFLTNEIFNSKKIAIFASLIYVLYPFTLVYDRMALYDSLVAMFMIWAIYFEVLLVRHMRLDLALILGMIIGGGMLTKTHAMFALILLPLSLLFFNWKAKNWKKLLGKWVIFALVAICVASAMYLILRLSPFFHIIAEKNYVFGYRPEELIQAPFAYFLHNLSPLSDWVIKYMTLPFLILVPAAFLTGKSFFKEKLFLLAWFLLPMIATAFVGRLLYPRFILFMTIPLLVLGTYALYQMFLSTKKMWLRIVIFVVFLSSFVINDFFIITDFAKARIPRSDLGQFMTDWPSGVGVKETIDFLKEKSKTEKIFVATEGTFGLMPYSLEMYFIDNPNITIKGIWPINDTMPEEVIAASKIMPVYFVFYQPCVPCESTGVAPKQWSVEPVFQVKKINDKTYYTLYKVK